jgi:hypothetical protein
MSTSGVPPLVYEKAANAVYIGSVFLKHLIESGMQLYLSFEGDEAVLKDVLGGKRVLDLTFRIFRLEVRTMNLGDFPCKTKHAIIIVVFSLELRSAKPYIHIIVIELQNHTYISLSLNFIADKYPRTWGTLP